MPTELSAESQTKIRQQNTADQPTPGFGWTQYAERINGRFAMIGFVALVITEWATKQDFFTWIGLR